MNESMILQKYKSFPEEEEDTITLLMAVNLLKNMCIETENYSKMKLILQKVMYIMQYVHSID